MSGIYYTENIDIAIRFLKRYQDELTGRQILQLVIYMKNGETYTSRNSVDRGGKILHLINSQNPIGDYNKDIAIQSVDQNTIIILPDGSSYVKPYDKYEFNEDEGQK